jgi:hypothetical protein
LKNDENYRNIRKSLLVSPNDKSNNDLINNEGDKKISRWHLLHELGEQKRIILEE